jgi:S-adenosylmethionine:tRNA ribosyltransferase-isomerase
MKYAKLARMLKQSDFGYLLPETSIAQTPSHPRDMAKLLVFNRNTSEMTHLIFKDLSSLLSRNDVLVLNDSKVFPARLKGNKVTGGAVEILLLRPLGANTWEAMCRGLKPPQIVHFSDELIGHVLSKNNETGYISIKLESSKNVNLMIDKIGATPIPPYIHSPLSEAKLRKEYQNVYANQTGSAAAPTAGMHFTQELLDILESNGVQIEKVTLHVGPGTFAKLRPEQIESKTLHHEWYSIEPATAYRLNQAKQQGKRIVAVGTTACRTLESCSIPGSLIPGSGQTNLFIMPPYKFNFVDAIITNFHLPESSLLMLITAFCHEKKFKGSIVEKAYLDAIKNNYRFFSFGDAMFIV